MAVRCKVWCRFQYRAIYKAMYGAIKFLAIGLGASVGLVTSIGLGNSPALAIDAELIDLLTRPLETAPPEPCRSRLELDVVTQQTICQKGAIETGLTDPSLWWTQEQFGEGIIQNWFAFPSTEGRLGRVDLLVNQDVWNDTDYLNRYVLINQFGTTAQQFGYNTRVFNPNGELLGAYICQDKVDCRIFLNPFGRSALRGATAPFGASSPINGGTAR
jgi:hypothetical protein